MNDTPTSFKGSQSEMLSIARSGITSCRKNLAAFAEQSSLYTSTYLDGLAAKIEEASNTETAPLRRKAQGDAHLELTSIAGIILANSQKLKGFIERAATKQQLSLWLFGAGLGYYEKASAYNWSAMQDMVNTGAQFISANLGVLTSKGYMLPDFPAKFYDQRKMFIQALDDFYEAGSDKVEDTESRLALYGEIYSEIIAMFKDGQKIFTEESIRRQFVYDLILNKMRMGGVASVFGFITNTETQQLIEGVTVYSIDKSYSAVSDEKGEYEISQMAADSYTLTFEKAGYETVTHTIEVKTGTAAKADISLKAIEFALKVA
jgi:hypothetical protein